MNTHTHTNTNTHTYKHTHTNTYKHTHIQTHTHTNTRNDDLINLTFSFIMKKELYYKKQASVIFYN